MADGAREMGWVVLRRDGDRRPATPRRRRLALVEVGVGGAALLAAHILLALGVEPVPSWFYCFAWWPTILLLDGVNYLREGESLFLTRTRTALGLLPLSVTIWLVFEVWNLRLENWAYIFVPRGLAFRWAGMTVAFATVLPGLFQLADLLQSLGWPRRAPVPALRVGRGGSIALCAVGVAFLVAPLLWPRYAYPLVWGGFVLVLDPLARAAGRPSILGEWRAGHLTTFVRLLLAGLVAGGLWEFYNFWARTKWVYTVPGLEGIKLFEMPPLGFLGFPPFAVECFVMSVFAGAVVARVGRGGGWGRRAALLVGLGVVQPAFWLGTFAAIDRATVVSHAPHLQDFPGLAPTTLERLREEGIFDPFLLVEAVGSRGLSDLAAGVGVPEASLRPIVEMARLSVLAGLGAENARRLHARGIRDASHLAAVPAERIEAWLREAPGPRTLPVPRRAIIRIWQRAAARAATGPASRGGSGAGSF